MISFLILLNHTYFSLKSPASIYNKMLKKILIVILSTLLTLNPLAVYAQSSGDTFNLFNTQEYEIFEQNSLPKTIETQEVRQEQKVSPIRYSKTTWKNVVQTEHKAYYLEDVDYENAPLLEDISPSFYMPYYQSQISVTGRKVLDFELDSKKYTDENESTIQSRSYSNFVMEQQLQLTMKGNVGDRIFANINYDDQRDDEQDILISYRGKDDEVVQSADFGDIMVSLPITELVAFNKQIFGAKMALKYKNADFFLLGSQTKGSKKQKRFVGNSIFQRVSIADKEYVRRQYYDLTFDNNVSWSIGITPDTEKIYLDDNDIYNANDHELYDLTAQDLDVPTSTYTARFKLLRRGIDYTVDYNRGILKLKYSLKENDVVAVDFQNTAGTWISSGASVPNDDIKIVKTENDLPIASSSEIGYQLEIKRFYFTGQSQIVRDNGLGNFFLKLFDSNGTYVGDTASPTQIYNEDVFIDFEQGIFELNQRMSDDPGLYNSTPVSTKNRFWRVEFESRLRTFFVQPDMVVNSDVVLLNGSELTRNEDYYVDYKSGFINFYDPDTVGKDSVIDVFYDVEGLAKKPSLLGGRLGYNLSSKMYLGGSVLYESEGASGTTPFVSNTLQDLKVFEADFSAKDINITENLKTTLYAEGARSIKNPNTDDQGIVDNMEGVKEYIRTPLTFNEWLIAANPGVESATPGSANSYFDAIKWDSEEIKALEINPDGQSGSNETQRVLTINYDFTENSATNNEISLVYPLSETGLDFTNKNLMDLTLYSDTTSGPEINIHFGQINELSDSSSGEILSCSKYTGNTPKTEDIDCTGTLSGNEDIGWLYENPDGTLQRYDPFINNTFNKFIQPNGMLDTQDLDGDGQIDYYSSALGGSFGYLGTDIDSSNLPGNIINFSGWESFQTEIDTTDENRWSNVKHVRITLRKPVGGADTGTIKVAALAVSGSSWKEESTSGLEVYGINNIDNPTDYDPIFSDTGDGGTVYRYLYGDPDAIEGQAGVENLSEQSLALKFDMATAPGGEAIAFYNIGTSLDLSKHKELRFLLHSSSYSNSTFFFKIGSDTNYTQVDVDLNYNGWRLYKFAMTDINGDNIPDELSNISDYSGVTVSKLGYVNFKEVGLMKAGVKKTNGAGINDSGEVWFNEIHQMESELLEGSAYLARVNFEYKDYLEFKSAFRGKDKEFETPMTVASMQDQTEQDYWLKYSKIETFPITVGYNTTSYTTPNSLGERDDNLVSLLSQGKVNSDKAFIRGEYTKPDKPKITVQYSYDNTDYDYIQRKDADKKLSIDLDHEFKDTSLIFKNLEAGYSRTTNKINNSITNIVSAPTEFYNANEKVDNVNLKFKANLWKDSYIIPNYYLTEIKEDRMYYESTNFIEKSYPKSLDQQTGFTSNFKIFKWLIPQISYKVSTYETNNLFKKDVLINGVSETYDIGEVKNLTRKSNGGISLNLNGKEFLPKSKLFNSFVLANSYKLDDADSWEDIERGYKSKNKLWLREELDISNPLAYRKTLTLRDIYSSILRWSPLTQYNKLWSPLRTLNIYNNFKYTDEDSEETGTLVKSKTILLPDLVLSIYKLEEGLGISNTIQDSNLRLSFAMTDTKASGISKTMDIKKGLDLRFMLLNYFDNALVASTRNYDQKDLISSKTIEKIKTNSASYQIGFKPNLFRFTPRIEYFSTETAGVNGVVTDREKDIIPSLNIRADFNLKKGLIPINETIKATNRIIWDTNISYTSKRAPLNINNNYNLLDARTNLDYEAIKNIRIVLYGGASKLWHEYLPQENYIAYNIGSTIIIQF